MEGIPWVYGIYGLKCPWLQLLVQLGAHPARHRPSSQLQHRPPVQSGSKFRHTWAVDPKPGRSKSWSKPRQQQGPPLPLRQGGTGDAGALYWQLVLFAWARSSWNQGPFASFWSHGAMTMTVYCVYCLCFGAFSPLLSGKGWRKRQHGSQLCVLSVRAFRCAAESLKHPKFRGIAHVEIKVTASKACGRAASNDAAGSCLGTAACL